MNYRFNLDEWLARFPFQDLEDPYDWYRGEIITSPWHICQNENLRRELQDQYDWGTPVPVDVFIMADGEPPDRHVTKIGGVPYWPANAKWPARPNGTPLIFLGQINFCDSKDMTGDLPGDLLLIFADSGTFPELFALEWQRMVLSHLIEAADVPPPPSAYALEADLTQRAFIQVLKSSAEGLFKDLPDSLPPPSNVILPCYGHIWRTVSFPNARPRNASTRQPICRGKEVRSEYWLPQYQATQIGSAPFFVQKSDPEVVIGRVLCTLNSVWPACDVPFPWINREAPIPFDPNHQHLNMGDTGCIYVSIDAAGQLHCHWSCY